MGENTNIRISERTLAALMTFIFFEIFDYEKNINRKPEKYDEILKPN